ncbi:class I SAM-dependent methyltransferase [Actinocorallia sp. API 0066]|uniref:class I SAM-dependent methyltransferase n=1 Tax=Actinocorallia sp. API 0066 TaxID=2896846 RepID=UPI001E40B7C2|nr:methyltransferase domain-containing protein [Actinocorallia sp. API 0066]MCD0448153.1 class I SAM-dependent methyltransferase [Actinocorallia sp. API 0066]
MLPLPGRPHALRTPAEDPHTGYWKFYRAVAHAQLARWLPRRSSVILDVSGGQSRSAEQAAAAGHHVLEVVSRPLGLAAHPRVVADPFTLDFLVDGGMDAVIAEDGVLSRSLATEQTVHEIARVLRPGGRVLLCVDSLTLGLAVLAEQNLWPHLSDVPRAEVVLVPWPDGTITRCFWSDQLREFLADAGLEVEWIRPRTVVSPSTAEHVLTKDPDALSRLVRTELQTPYDTRVEDESVGIHLLASAIKTW